MPEVKWVANHKLKNEPYPHIPDQVPVLMLDQIKAWLEGERLTLSQCVNSQQAIGRSSMIDDLLAQVQAWKESK